MIQRFRFRTLFFRQWLNSMGIPLVAATLLLSSFDLPFALAFLFVTAILFLFLTLFFAKTNRERSVSLLFATLGIALALLFFALALRSVESARLYTGKIVSAEGCITAEKEGAYTLRLTSLDGKLSVKKIRLESEEKLGVGKRVKMTFKAVEAGESDLADGVFLCGKLLSSEDVGENKFVSLFSSLRHLFAEALGSGRTGTFLKAILLGEKDSLSQADTDAFRKTASSHLIAISGLHISVLIGIARCVMDFLHLSRSWKTALLIPLVVFLFLITGGAVSVFRASFMTLFSVAAHFARRRWDSVTALTLAASLIVMTNPFAVTDLSFLFSFTSTFAIVTVASPLCEELSERIRPLFMDRMKKPLLATVAYLVSALLVSASVTLFSLPINLIAFGEIQPLAPVYSVLLIPIFTPCVTAGVLFLFLSLFPVSVPLTEKAVCALNECFLELVSLLSASAPPLISFGIYSVSAALFVSVLLVLLMCFRRKLWDFLLLYAFLFLLILPLMIFA